MNKHEIDSFNVILTGDCGDCTPNTTDGRLSVDVTTYTCIGWIPDGQTCIFQVKTASKDCQLLSESADYRIILDSKPLICIDGNYNSHVSKSYAKI